MPTRLAARGFPGTAIALGAAAAATTAVSQAAAQQKISQAAAQGDFASAVQAAFAGDYTLDWRGGNVTLTAPIVLVASPGNSPSEYG